MAGGDALVAGDCLDQGKLVIFFGRVPSPNFDATGGKEGLSVPPPNISTLLSSFLASLFIQRLTLTRFEAAPIIATDLAIFDERLRTQSLIILCFQLDNKKNTGFPSIRVRQGPETAFARI